MRSNTRALISAGFGGITPTLLGLAISLTTNGSGVPNGTADWMEYTWGLVLFAGLAAGVVFVWQETNLKRAFYLGIGVPALINTASSNISLGNSAEGQDNREAGLFQIVSSAYAQEHETSLDIKGRKLKISTPEDTPEYTVEFLLQKGEPDKEKGKPPETELNVPPNSTHFRIAVGNSTSEKVKLSQTSHSTTKIRVEISRRSLRGLYKALGVKKVPKYEIKVTKVED